MARSAVPDTNRVSSDSGLSAESADVFCVLGDFHLFDLLTEGGTVSGEDNNYQHRILSIVAHFLPFSCNCAIPFVLPYRGVVNGLKFSSIAGFAPTPFSTPRNNVLHIPGTVFTGDTDLLGSLRHFGWRLLLLTIVNKLCRGLENGLCINFRIPVRFVLGSRIWNKY